MLRFFRQIRKKLMEQNKIRTYLLYAIGEILLVVIGILIALQINNWNENRLNRQEQARILSDINIEITEAISSREGIIREFEEYQRGISLVLLKLFDSESSQLTEDECLSVFASQFLSWDPINISTLEEIVTSGKIGILQDQNLRSKLVQFRNVSQSNTEFLAQIIISANVLVDDFPELIPRTWNEEAQFSDFNCDLSEMKENQSFLNQFQSNHGRMNAPINVAERELEYLRDISDAINKIMVN